MSGKQWFEEWFNSPYYHLLYAHRNEQEAEDFIGKISRHLQIPPDAAVLDVACGKGRHAITLAKLGFNVTGIDLSPNSIRYAQQFANDNLHFTVWDMRQVFRPSSFDFVFNLFSSFGYFDDDADDLAAIRAMYDNLKPDGTLVLDYINTEAAVKNMKPREIVPRGDIQFHITKKIERGFIRKQINFLAEGESHEFTEQLKVINHFRFQQMLQQTGFTLVETLGDYDLHTFTTSSPRLILIAKK